MVESRIVSKKMIKPSSPTPSSLRCHKLSFLDQIAVSSYAPMASFYTKPENYSINQISDILENSLSKLLSFYYPFAGKIIDNKYVDCNDTGAEYLNVQIHCPVSQVLKNPNANAIDIVFPQDLPWNTPSSDTTPLVVQLSHFDCGGVAVSVCISHKIVDGYSISKFLIDWASIALDHQLRLTCTARDHELSFKPSPWFGTNLLLPPLLDDPPTVQELEREPQRLSRVYHFTSSSLNRLKEIVVATNSGVQNPTRVEVATALLHKCGVASSSSSTGMSKPSLLWHMMTLRPPFPLNAIGNHLSYFTSIAATEDEIQVPNFVHQLSKAKQHARDQLKDVNLNQLGSRAIEESKVAANIMTNSDTYMCTSICNFEFYKIDFGWGRPIRVTPAPHARKNSFIFLDDPNGDGIHVLITLSKPHMLVFESNKELLEFATPLGHQ